MKILESILKEGNVYIACRCGHLLVACFISHDEKKVIVSSDRGIDHLCMLLIGEITSDYSIKKEANEKYANSLSSMMPVSEEVSILEKSYTKLSYPPDVKQYRVSFKQIAAPALNAIPGIYRKRAYGSTLEEAFSLALNTDPELLL